ncbi:MAG: hypothetical protein RBR52_10305 [Thiomonas sp.]|uniref:hypothetical protein n=1 Tax=Thiomonas sp. TaxID=2047785 RepID=UPI002A36F9CA|nr:hypothetical protein [Thiomonas sp.]MDY0330874.1 hypothetical protein [Thiomonas sp.]
MKKSLLTVALSALALSSAALAQETRKPLTFSEIQTIRIMAGGVVGNALAKTMERPHLGVLANRSVICNDLAGGIGGTLTVNKADSQLTFESVKDKAETAPAIARLLPSDGIYMAFGGEWKKEENMALLEAALEQLAEHHYKGSVIFHVTTWAQKQPQEIAARNPRIAKYFETATLRAVTLDLNKKEAMINKITFDGKDYKLSVAATAPLRDDLVELFKRQ